jgi:hypothetical protein
MAEVVRPSKCLSTAPVWASTITVGRVGVPPRELSAK